MKGHLGHAIQITGKITDVEKSEIELMAGESGNGFTVEIEAPGKNVVTAAGNAAVNAESRPNTNDIPITSLKLNIDDLKMTTADCEQPN